MRNSYIPISSLSEDGHPCEAALEFRRIAIRKNLVEDISVGGLDLAVSFAWIGKAISRTTKVDPWVQTNVDPNTWEIIRAMALDIEVRRLALNDALHAEALPNHTKAISDLRRSSAFKAAAERVQSTITANVSHNDALFLVGELQFISKLLDGPEIKLNVAKSPNLVSLAAFRQQKELQN